MNTFQQRRDEVITTLIDGDEQSARVYIESIGDSDERDAARTHLAQFLTNRNLACNRALKDVFQIVGEIENLTEKLDSLLAISRILNGHHRLNEAREVLRDIETLSQGSSERAGFTFLIAIELECLGLRSDVIQALKRALALSSMVRDDSSTAKAALWMARWGAEGDAETAINALTTESIRDNAVERLKEIRAFKRREVIG